jgi:hypothetical protein
MRPPPPFSSQLADAAIPEISGHLLEPAPRLDQGELPRVGPAPGSGGPGVDFMTLRFGRKVLEKKIIPCIKMNI